jgi:hypothetical protein
MCTYSDLCLLSIFLSMEVNGGSPCSVKSSINETIAKIPKMCSNTIENQVFLNSFYSSLSNLPGSIFTLIFIDKLGRNLVTSKTSILIR